MPESSVIEAQPATAATAAPASNGGGWADALDPDLKGWASGMGLDKLPERDALAKVLPMYRGAEQKLGVPADQILRMPKDENDLDGYRAIMAKLGAPEKPEDYGIAAPEGQAGEFLKTATGWFHELGIPKRAASALAEKWNGHMSAMAEAEAGKWDQRFEQEITGLKGEWNADYDKNVDLAKRVMRATGFASPELQAIERALGPAAMLKGFVKFASSIGEHRFVEGGANTNFGMTPESARQRITDLQKDADWMSKYISGDADKKAEWTRLHQVAYPEEKAA
jgi:hypothetical protein